MKGQFRISSSFIKLNFFWKIYIIKPQLIFWWWSVFPQNNLKYFCKILWKTRAQLNLHYLFFCLNSNHFTWNIKWDGSNCNGQLKFWNLDIVEQHLPYILSCLIHILIHFWSRNKNKIDLLKIILKMICWCSFKIWWNYFNIWWYLRYMMKLFKYMMK